MATQILLVDDHQLMREALRSILERDPDLVVVGEAPSGCEALRRIASLRPDVVIMDVVMRGMNGIEATREIRRHHRGVAVVALSNHSDSRYVRAMLEAGASAYVLKADAYHELRRAIRAAVAGKSYVVTRTLSDPLDGEADSRGAEESVYEILGPRERHVLQLVAEGLSSPEIAARLCIAVVTVETHRRNLVRKLGIHSVAELTKYAIREGLTDIDS